MLFPPNRPPELNSKTGHESWGRSDRLRILGQVNPPNVPMADTIAGLTAFDVRPREGGTIDLKLYERLTGTPASSALETVARHLTG